ncbi:MAG: tRNA(Met) cytidine acetyltransferase, partial [Gammaproteobacteria bacterium]|nr:tRNA(Met) cytidine acetyltransferase [Gammaproteobacteria bacterium]
MNVIDKDFLFVTGLVGSLKGEARAANHRRVLVLAGERNWCLGVAGAVVAGTPSGEWLWIGNEAAEGSTNLEMAAAHQVLGRELDGVVFDVFSGFDPDAFGAVSGAIRGGGLLLLLTPSLDEWPAFPDPQHARITVFPYQPIDVTGRFLQRMVGVLRSSPDVVLIEQGRDAHYQAGGMAPPGPEPGHDAARSGDSSQADEECRTGDQRLAVEAVVGVVTGHRRRPVVLVSDRGRGKSAALGIATARLLRDGGRRIVITGPRLDAVGPVFEHARRLLSGAIASRTSLHLGAASLEFAPPDELVLQPVDADLVLVDEAAAIPSPLLARLLEHYSRIAFATTIHGYEGTGRGFALRFQRVLERETPEWRLLELKTPIRWSPGDPLERLVFRALALDASPAPDELVTGALPESCTVERLDRDRLVEDQATLAELFGLLVLSHYRTTPNDLRNLLDGPNLSVHIMRFHGHVVATALVAEEGGFDKEIAREIWAG